MRKPLLAKVTPSDRDAIDSCLDRYGNLVWSLARHFTAGRADAEDAVREIFIDLWESADRFDPAKSTEATFVAMIARRRLVDRLRKRKREPRMGDLTAVATTAGDSSSGDPETQTEANRASKLIRTLEPEQQKVIRLAVYHGHTHRTIAEATGMPLGTVKTHLRRGLVRLREALGQEAWR